MSYTLVLEWMPGDLYMSAVTARCTAPTSSYSVVWLPPNKVYQITLYCGSTSLVSFLVGAFRGKAWSYMNKNFNLENAKSIIAEASGVPVNTTFGSITKPIDLLLEVIDMSADLIALIHEETELKKHHRAYLHVHEELEDCADQMAERMQEIFDETTDCVIKLMKDVHETFRVRKQEAAEDDADTVTIAKEDYETMIDDLLTMSEIIQCVADMRTQDMKAIREFGKFVPAFAAFEKNRLSLYREAAKETEEIFDRWADEIDDLDEDFMEDEDYEPDEYYSD